MNKILAPNASNLAEVLQNLSATTRLFERFNEAVRAVLPQIYEVSVRPANGEQAEIVVYRTELDSEREDFARPLSDCGTGISQVLAILYVVFTSNTPRIILIDEPNSFLHPGAVRNLIEILKDHPQHQYIVTTHSPALISATDPATLTIIREQDGSSNFYPIDVSKTEQLSEALIDVGASLSDVFGADTVLWVEGPTEKEAFPLIIKQATGRSLIGTAIVGVRSTGDIEGKHAEALLDIYRQISQGQSLLPPAIGFILDIEGKDAKKQEDLQRRCPELRFLPRRMYENYLLHPMAISAVVNGYTDFSKALLTVENISEWIEQHRNEAKYGMNTLNQAGDWVKYIDGAKLLSDLFKELSEARYEYVKTRDSIMLTKWLLENEPDELKEIADLLRQIIPPSNLLRATSS